MYQFVVRGSLVAVCCRDRIRLMDIKLYGARLGVASFDLLAVVTLEKNVEQTGFNISEDRRLVCVADSTKNVVMYHYRNKEILPLMRPTGNDTTIGIIMLETKMEHKIVRIGFDRWSKIVILVDKAGDVYTSHIISATGQFTVPRKAMGVCSVVLEAVITDDHRYLITCDRDAKIRVNHYPDTYDIDGYLLGHKEAVIAMALLKSSKFLLSGSHDGELKLWDLTSKACLHTWSIFESLKHLWTSDPGQKYQIDYMRIWEHKGDKVLLVSTFRNESRICVFQLDLETNVLKHCFLLLSDYRQNFEWCPETDNLYFYTPEEEERERLKEIKFRDGQFDKLLDMPGCLFDNVGLDGVPLQTDKIRPCNVTRILAPKLRQPEQSVDRYDDNERFKCDSSGKLGPTMLVKNNGGG